MKIGNSIQVLSTPRTGSSAFGKLLSESGFAQAPFPAVENQSASEFNANGYFEDAEMNLCFDNLIRFAFTDRNSFIYNSGMTPDKSLLEKNLKERFFLKYDLDEEAVVLPQDYVPNLKSYTGHDWDVWGLTRMQPDRKWHLAYSRAGVETPQKALSKFKNMFAYLGSVNFTFIKDPRLIYLLPLMESNIRAVIIKRNPDEILRSMRNHYGPNLFTSRVVHDDWVSNHFNYRVQPQEFEDYLAVYRSFETYAVNNFQVAFIDYEKLYDKDELKRLSKSIGVELKWKQS